MSTEEFEDTVRRYMYHEPPVPFVFELNDGQEIVAVDPTLVLFNEGAACYIGFELELLSFSYDDVKTIRPLLQGVAS